MGIFGWKKKTEETDEARGDEAKEATPAPKPGTLEFSPEKARRFFDYARQAMDTSRFEYAMLMWLNGLRQDPGNMDGVQGFFNAADRFRASGGTGLSREIRNALGSTPVDRYLNALAEWSMKPTEVSLGIRAAQAPAELGLTEVAKWVAPRALDVLTRESRPRKDHAIRLMEVFQKIEQFDYALKACEIAVKADPSDTKLSADFKNFSALATMNKGGYEKTGEAGGFRANIRDADRQRMLEESESITRGDDVAQRVIAAAKAAYLANTADKPTIRKYVDALSKRGTPSDIQEAISVLDRAYTDTQEFQFRRLAGELRMRVGRKELKTLRDQAEKNPGDEALAQRVKAAESAQVELEISEYEAQALNYPTDLGIKFELGKRYAQAGRHEDAIGQFQQAKADPRNRSAVLLALGEAFFNMDWQDEAVETYRQALEGHADPNDGVGLELRFGLLRSLQKRAESAGDLSGAEEAYKLASSIAIQNIGFKDIRARRDQLKALIAQLKGGS